MAVTTRAQMKKQEEEAAIQEERGKKSGADPNPIEEALLQEGGAAGVESGVPGAEFADELFSGGKTTGRKARRSMRIITDLCRNRRSIHWR